MRATRAGWFGNLQVTRNLAVSNASYTAYSVPIPDRPAFAEQRRHAQRSVRHQHAHDGEQSDHAPPKPPVSISRTSTTASTSTPPRDWAAAMQVSGGVSIGRERTNNCDLTGNLSFVVQRGRSLADRPRLLRRASAVPAAVEGAMSATRCQWGIQVSANFQSLSGPRAERQLSADQRHRVAVARPQLHQRGADGRAGAAGHDVRRPHLPDGHSLQQDDQGRADDHSSDDFDSTTCSTPTRSRPTPPPTAPRWLAPTVILNPRFMDFGVQIDF